VLDRRDVSEFRVASLAVVEDLDVVEHRIRKVDPDAPFLPITQLWMAAALTPSSTAAVVIDLPARTSATALLRNSTGKGLGMGEASQDEPDPQTISGNQTVRHVRRLARFDGHVEGIDDEMRVLGGVDRPADDFSRERVMTAQQYTLP
jgi:hypothetical protein